MSAFPAAATLENEGFRSANLVRARATRETAEPYEQGLPVPKPGIADKKLLLTASTLGTTMERFAIMLLQLLFFVTLVEIFGHRRYVSDGLMLGLAIAAFGWWLTVRKMRTEAKDLILE